MDQGLKREGYDTKSVNLVTENGVPADVRRNRASPGPRRLSSRRKPPWLASIWTMVGRR